MALLTMTQLINRLLVTKWDKLPEGWRVRYQVQHEVVFDHESGHASVTVHETDGISEHVQEVGSLIERATLHREVSAMLDALVWAGVT